MSGMSAFYAIAKFVTNLLIHILYKMRYEGVENIPEGDGAEEESEGEEWARV